MSAGWLLLLGPLLAPSSVTGADDANRFALKGAGFLPCQVFVNEREKQSNVYYMIGGWVEGYVSAYNKLTADNYDVMSFEALELLLEVMDNHCRSNANDPLHAVLSAMLAQMESDRIRQESSSVEIAEGERRTRLYRETIRRMQSALTSLGLYKGEVDGRFTDQTRSALLAFQSDLGFETTGFPDQATLWRLLR